MYFELMECTKCHKLLSIDNFSYKNLKEKILYLHCDKCRDKIKHNPDKKQREKEQYNFTKMTNIICCECGIKYISFRTYHTSRHLNSKKHKKILKND